MKKHAIAIIILFDISEYIAGAAHPLPNSLVINYDLAQGRELALADLFILDSSYLDHIAAYCVGD